MNGILSVCHSTIYAREDVKAFPTRRAFAKTRIVPNTDSLSPNATARMENIWMANLRNNVEDLLGEIRENTSNPWWRMLLNGALYGAGAVIGTVLTIVLLGWLLSVFGVIPGFGELAAQLQSALNEGF
jgi:hypothetical protein